MGTVCALHHNVRSHQTSKRHSEWDYGVLISRDSTRMVSTRQTAFLFFERNAHRGIRKGQRLLLAPSSLWQSPLSSFDISHRRQIRFSPFWQKGEGTSFFDLLDLDPESLLRSRAALYGTSSKLSTPSVPSQSLTLCLQRQVLINIGKKRESKSDAAGQLTWTIYELALFRHKLLVSDNEREKRHGLSGARRHFQYTVSTCI